MSKTERITFMAAPDQVQRYESMARRMTEGNLSMLIRKALDAYQGQHALVDVTTEYEVETQFSN